MKNKLIYSYPRLRFNKTKRKRIFYEEIVKDGKDKINIYHTIRRVILVHYILWTFMIKDEIKLYM